MFLFKYLTDDVHVIRTTYECSPVIIHAHIYWTLIGGTPLDSSRVRTGHKRFTISVTNESDVSVGPKERLQC